jgi:hypothetical protein
LEVAEAVYRLVFPKENGIISSVQANPSLTPKMKINFRTDSSVKLQRKSCVSSVVPRVGETIELPALKGGVPFTAAYTVSKVVWELNDYFMDTDDLQVTVHLFFLKLV